MSFVQLGWGLHSAFVFDRFFLPFPFPFRGPCQFDVSLILTDHLHFEGQSEQIFFFSAPFKMATQFWYALAGKECPVCLESVEFAEYYVVPVCRVREV